MENVHRLIAFVVVVVGWVFSLCLHEFSHAFVAYKGGDYTVRQKGYLSFNPLKYTHPVYSIVMPLVFLLLGGIGLPGGAVYIETWRLRSRQWSSAVSLAGPASNLLCALALAGILQIPGVSESSIGPVLAFLTLLEISSVILNLIPIPPLDGYQAISAYLPRDVEAKIAGAAQIGLVLLFLALWYVPAFNKIYWRAVYDLCGLLGVPGPLAYQGLREFAFWTR
ncbi:MAG: site-2 protease family protein [Planctomycetes bacterium]|nr:site-2 protease family protein [Planctomycetota bacterium]